MKKKKTARSVRAAALTVDRRTLARLFACSLRHVTELEAEGVIVPLTRGRGGKPSTYALEAALPAYLRRMTESPTSGSEREARRRRDMAQAQLTELRIAREEGGLIERADVVSAGQHYTRTWRAMVLALPTQLVVTGAIAKEQKPAVEAGCRQLLTEISRWQVPADSPQSPAPAQPERKKKK